MEMAYLAVFVLLIIFPRILRNMFGVHIPLWLESVTALFLILALLFGSIANFYEKFSWWDGALHFSSGLVLTLWAFIAMRALNKRGSTVSVSPVFIAFFAACFSVALSALWEMYEFGYDIFMRGSMTESDLPDTLGDMIANLIGTLIVAVFAYRFMKKRRRIPLTVLDLN